MILYNKQITKALIRLRICADWSAPLLFANHRRWRGSSCIGLSVWLLWNMWYVLPEDGRINTSDVKAAMTQSSLEPGTIDYVVVKYTSHVRIWWYFLHCHFHSISKSFPANGRLLKFVLALTSLSVMSDGTGLPAGLLFSFECLPKN